MNKAREHLAPVWKRPAKLEIERGEGAYLYGIDGEQYLDFTSGIAVTGTGHCHPRVVRAIQEQAAKLIHGQVTLMYTTPVLELVDELMAILPPELDGFFFGNSGTEAVEAALKLARQVTGRHGIIAFTGAFHGRTYGAMSVTTSNAAYRTGYAPLLGSVFVAPYPYPYRWAFRTGAPRDRCLDSCLGELEELFVTQVPAAEVAAILVEPIQGEGGYIVPPDGFLRGLREITQKHGILLVVDEIQSGLGRTGRMFAFEHEGIVPDVVILAKALGSGLPISAVAARWDVMGRWTPRTHGGTYAANPVACAAAAETLRVIRDERLVENAHEMGRQLLEGLEAIASSDSGVGETRGLGLMAAMELVQDGGHPDADRTARFLSAAREQDMLLASCSPHKNVVRFMPPLIVTENQVAEALQVTRLALKQSR